MCEQSGTGFDEAFFPGGMPPAVATDTRDTGEEDAEAESADRTSTLFVLCPTCDEPFEPEFPRRCEWCGHTFADGRELPPVPPREPSEFNARVAIALVGVIAIIVGLIAFFARLVSKD
ncbi:MAG: hypothetical protein AB7O59_05220 [Pirellulales bacterium]